MPMRDPGEREAAVEDELVTFIGENFLKHYTDLGLVPPWTHQRLAIGQSLVQICVPLHDRVADAQQVGQRRAHSAF